MVLLSNKMFGLTALRSFDTDGIIQMHFRLILDNKHLLWNLP